MLYGIDHYTTMKKQKIDYEVHKYLTLFYEHVAIVS